MESMIQLRGDAPSTPEDTVKSSNPSRIRKGEIWELDCGRFKVIRATFKTVQLRRLSDA